MVRSTVCAIVSLQACFLLGCKDESQPVTGFDRGTVVYPDSTVARDSSTPPPGDCNCTADQVCDSNNRCIARPQPVPDSEALAEIVLEHYVDPTFPTVPVTGGAVGRYDTMMYVQANPPWSDPRKRVAISDGNFCLLDSFSCGYPFCQNDQVWLPPGLGGGNLTFTVAGAPGPIVLEPFNSGGSGPADWGYGLSDTQPGPLKEGAVTYASWFDKQYVPLGASFQLTVAGGPDLKAGNYPGVQIPTAFQITSPPANQAVPTDRDLTISWSPPQPGAIMNLEIVSGMALRCAVRDTGSVTIPVAALAQLGGVSYITFSRDVTRYFQTTTTTGKTVHLYVTGRNGIGHRLE